jgi:hypothetical protein
MMDMEINYPYGIPFYTDVDMIFFTIINNSQDIIYIYLKKDNKNNLANIIFPFTKKKFNFPKGKISVYLEKDLKKVICFINIKNGWTYIYP